MRHSQLLDDLLIMSQTLILSSLEYFKQPLILFLEFLGDLAILGQHCAQVIAGGDLEIGDLLEAPLPLLKQVAQVVLEHLHVVRLVLLYDALHAYPPPTVQAVGLALVPRVQWAHRVETSKYMLGL
jgi:hypothetical protein